MVTSLDSTWRERLGTGLRWNDFRKPTAYTNSTSAALSRLVADARVPLPEKQLVIESNNIYLTREWRQIWFEPRYPCPNMLPIKTACLYTFDPSNRADRFTQMTNPHQEKKSLYNKMKKIISSNLPLDMQKPHASSEPVISHTPLEPMRMMSW